MKKKILMLSDSIFTNTGYSTITRNILNGLSDDYECHALCHNYVGQSLPPGIRFKDGYTCNFWIHGTGREPYCKDVMIPLIQELQPDYFIILLDTFMLYPWLLDMNFAPAKTSFYFPSDGGGGLPQGCEAIISHLTRCVAMSKFAQWQAKTVHGLDTDYIPHAVDTINYRPLTPAERLKARQEMTVLSINGAPVKGLLQNKFVVGVVARNQGRKALDATVKAFAKFCKDKPDAILYMHTDIYDAAAIFDMRYLIQRLGIQNRVVFSPMRFFKNYEYKEMNNVYNVMDIFYLSTTGEGFGIPTIEAMACEVPVVATDYTSTQELINDDLKAGLPVKIAAEITGSWCVERAIIDTDAAAACLDTLYHDNELRKRLGKNGRQKVLRDYDWQGVLGLWRQFLQKL